MRNKLLLQTLFALFFISFNYGCDVNNSEPEPTNINFEDRTFTLNVPQTYDANREYSLMFVFHGASGTGEGIRKIAQFDSYSSWKDIIICYPDALVENWEEGCRCNKPHRLGIDDVGYISFLIEKLTEDFNIDTSKIFGVGYSQGGLFAMNIGCKLSDKFAGIATVASPMSEPLFNECAPAKNISVLMIHGTHDPVLPYYGTTEGSFSLVSSPKAAQRWASFNGCLSSPETTELVKPGNNTGGVNKHEYVSCDDAKKVVLFEIVNGGHAWFNVPQFQATNEIINFFYPL